MEKLKFIKPTKEYEKQAYEYIEEFNNYNSHIYGTNGLKKFMNNYTGWLKKLEYERRLKLTDNTAPGETFMLIRENDNKIIGIISIKLGINKSLLEFAGNISFGIRPTERGKGYGTYQLYLLLKYCQTKNVDKVLIDCYKENILSSKTIKKCYGTFEKEYQYNGKILERYVIDINAAVDKLNKKYIANK